MPAEIVTKDDLQTLRVQIINDIRYILSQIKVGENESFKGLKTKHVREILGCCTNTLVSLRIAGKVRSKKIGGTVYYNKDDVKKLLEQGF